jgi:hypothetical protein
VGSELQKFRIFLRWAARSQECRHFNRFWAVAWNFMTGRAVYLFVFSPVFRALYFWAEGTFIRDKVISTVHWLHEYYIFGGVVNVVTGGT